MTNKISNTKKSRPKSTLMVVLACIGTILLGLIGVLFQESDIFEILKKAKPIDKIWETLTASISMPLYVLALIFLLLIVLSYLSFSYRNHLTEIIKKPMLKIRFNVKWDKEGIPFCPGCEIPIGETGHKDGGSILVCSKCKSNFNLQHEDGTYLLIEAARLMITKSIKIK